MEKCRRPRHDGDNGGAVSAPRVGIVMGSSSNPDVMVEAATTLAKFGVASEIHVVSAHRSPEAMIEYGKSARERGLRVIVAGAGGGGPPPGKDGPGYTPPGLRGPLPRC